MATSCAQSMRSPIHLSIEPRHRSRPLPIHRLHCSASLHPRHLLQCLPKGQASARSGFTSAPRSFLLLRACSSFVTVHCIFQICCQKLGVWAARTWAGLYCFCRGQIWVGAERAQRLSGRN